ncbi:CDP-alcohol phosphatidyltransferase family protein [Arthrobacter monumenti]
MLTVLRVVGVPLFVWFLARQEYAAGVLVLAIMAASDWIDGFIARRFNLVSKLGRILDPMADRFTLIVVAITMVATGVAPWWLVFSILVPDGILLITTLVLFRSHPGLPVSRVGKIRTGLLLMGTPLLLLGQVPLLAKTALEAVALVILLIGCIGHWIASYNYWWAAVRKYQARRRPQVSPST